MIIYIILLAEFMYNKPNHQHQPTIYPKAFSRPKPPRCPRAHAQPECTQFSRSDSGSNLPIGKR